MSLVRALRCALVALLVWPTLSTPLLLSVKHARTSVVRGMACCSTSCEGCDRCETGAAGACALSRGAVAGACTLAEAPCHKPRPTTLAPFAWDPFLANAEAFDRSALPARRFRAADPSEPSSRATPVPERPPAA